MAKISNKKQESSIPAFAKIAKENSFFATPSDFGISARSIYDAGDKKKLKDTFMDLVVFTPSKQSHLGTKLNDYTKLNNKSTNKFLQQVFRGLGIHDDSVYLFNTYESKSRKLNDLKPSVLKNKEPLLVLRCTNGVAESFLMSVRNSIAHGNIVRDGNYYLLYSVSDEKDEYSSKLTFLLRISNLANLSMIQKTLSKYM